MASCGITGIAPLIPERQDTHTMTVDLLTDTHIHTSLCNHASGTMEQYVQSAINRGLRRMVFLEHLETDINTGFRSWLTDEDFDTYFAEGRRLQKAYAGRIEIGLGAEVGYNPDCPQRIIERINQREWNRVGLSCHFFKIPDHDEHLNVLSNNPQTLEKIETYGAGRLLNQYFDTLIEAVQTIEADALCHLDAGLRHQPNLHLNDSHWLRIETLLQEVKRAGMDLEINTSGYTYRGKPFPLPEIICMAQEMGITFSVGSDSHHPEEIGRFFDVVPSLLS